MRQYKEGLFIVRKTGNAGAHYGQKVRGKDALVSVKYIYSFLKWFANIYADAEPDLPGHFDSSFIPKVGSGNIAVKTIKQEAEREKAAMLAEIEALLKKVQEQEEAAQASEAAYNSLQQERAVAQETIEHKSRSNRTALNIITKTTKCDWKTMRTQQRTIGKPCENTRKPLKTNASTTEHH